MDEEKLIAAVQKRPVIYDKQDQNYHNRDLIYATWEAIAKEVGSDVTTSACKNRWGTLRDYFFKKYRQSVATKSGQAASKKRKWYLFDAMSFLGPYYGSRVPLTRRSLVYEDQPEDYDVDLEDTESQLSPASQSSDDSAPVSQEISKRPPQQRKRKSDCTAISDFNMEILKALKEPADLDANEMFLKSLLPSVRKLNDIQAMEFRIEVQTLLLKHLKEANNPQNAAEPTTSLHGIKLDLSP